MSTNKLMQSYVELESQFKVLERERTLLREAIVEAFRKEKIEKFSDPVVGSFTIGRKITYKYSKAVRALSERLKIAKAKEEQKGTAKVEKETEYLLYTTPKEQIPE